MTAPPKDDHRVGPSRSLRLPLVTGHGTIGGFAMAGVFTVPAASFALLAIPATIAGHWVWGLALGVIGGFLSWESRVFVREAWDGRPSDLVLEGREVAIVGGPASGMRVAIADIDIDASGVRPTKDDHLGHDALELALMDGRRIVLARALGRDDFIAVLDVLRAAAGRAARAPGEWVLPETTSDAPRRRRALRRAPEAEATASVTPPPRIDVVACSSCGASQVPSESEHAPCHACGTACAMPQALRDRLGELAAIRTLGGKADRMLRRVLAQPSARASFVVFAIASVVTLVVWLGTIAMFSRALVLGELDDELQWRAPILPLLVGLVALLLAMRWLATRQAIQAVMLHFGALAPERAGDPPGCHGCGGPLAVAAGALVIGCAYCGAANVIGIDLPRDVRPQLATFDALRKALEQNAVELRFAGKAVLFVAPIALWAAWGCGRYVIEPSWVERLKLSCDHPDICFGLAVAEMPDAEKVAYIRGACELGHAEACTKLGAWQHEGMMGFSADPAAALPLFDRGCALGLADACDIATGLRAKAGG